MNLSVLWGIFSCSLLISVVIGLPFFQNKKWRLALTLAVMILVLCPFLPEGISVAQWLFSVTDSLSVLLVLGLIQQLVGRQFIVWNLWEIGFLFLLGLILYASSLGFLPDVVYGIGFRPIQATGMMLVCLGIVSDWYKRLCIVLTFLLFLLGFYPNFFDALFDPILWLIAFCGGLTKIIFRGKMKIPKS